MAWPKLRRRRSGPALDGARSSSAAAERGPQWRQEPVSARPAETADFGPVIAESRHAHAGSKADEHDLPLWDWAPPGDQPRAAGAAAPQAGAAASADHVGGNGQPLVAPAGQASGEPRQPGIGRRWGDLARLSANPRKRTWQRRAIIAGIVMVGFSLWISWRVGLTLAVIAVIADTIYRSRRSESAQAKLNTAQRRTRRQLVMLSRVGYRAMHAGLIPGSEDQIDHLVVGPAGVFAIDSEAWDKRLPVRTTNGRELWHGRYSKKERLEHARWESRRAAELLSDATRRPVTVRPALAVYGPKLVWDVVTIRDVDVFSGPRLRRYLRRRARQRDVRPLTDAEIDQLYKAADAAFPHLSADSSAS